MTRIAGYPYLRNIFYAHKETGISHPISHKPRTRLQTLNFGPHSPVIIHSADLQKLKDEIIDKMRSKQRYVEEDLEVLENAFHIMIRYHGGELHPSGERIAIHLLRTARTLAEWGASAINISAGLLHLIPLKKLQSSNVPQRLLEIIKSKQVLEKYLHIDLEGELTKREIKYLTKMCLMQEGNRDIWLLQAADEFTILTALDQTQNIASRAYHVTASILSWFDLDHIAVELEDIALFRLDKKEYERIESIITDANKMDRKKATEYLRALAEIIGEELTKSGFEHRTEANVKSVSRTLKKLLLGEELTDASRFRFIIKGTREDCKRAAEIVLSGMRQLGYVEMESERKNYVADIILGEKSDKNIDLGPKENGYESIHFHFRGPENEPINFQIRTEEMHEIAELGSASHGRFKLNGMIDSPVLPEATITRNELISSGRKYGIFNGKIYRLIPYPAGKNIRILDLAFAISSDHGLHCPEKVKVIRTDQNTGERKEIKNKDKKGIAVTEPLENGDEIIFDKQRRVSHWRQYMVATLAASSILKLEPKDLDPEARAIRSSTAEKQGEMTIKNEMDDWFAILRKSIISAIKAEKIDEQHVKFSTFSSINRTARLVGLENESALRRAVGLLNPRKREELTKKIMIITKNSSVAIAYQTKERGARAWMLISNVPGVLSSLLRLMDSNNLGVNSLIAGVATTRYLLLKLELTSRKKDIEEDLLRFLADLRYNLYEPTKPPIEIRSPRQIKIGFESNRCNNDLAIQIFESVLKQGAGLVSAELSHPQSDAGKKTKCCITVKVPVTISESYRKNIELKIKSLRKRINWLRLSGFEIEDV